VHTPVNCAGTWGSCSVTCGNGTQNWQITTPAAYGGEVCKDSSGTALTTTDNTLTAAGTKTCSGPACAADCLGSWSTLSACSATCGTGTQTRTFTATRQAASGGQACESKYGANAHYPSSTESINCSNLPACNVPTNCAGHWSNWGSCSQTCNATGHTGGGTQTRTYTIDTRAANGGAVCKDTDGTALTDASNNLTAAATSTAKASQSGCNNVGCCATTTVGAWRLINAPTCNSTGAPTQVWARDIMWANAQAAIAAGCSIPQTATTLSAADNGLGACPSVDPGSGTCSNGLAWSAGPLSSICALSPSSMAATITCPGSGMTYNSSTGKCEKSCPSKILTQLAGQPPSVLSCSSNYTSC
jgi:hypothetical protein